MGAEALHDLTAAYALDALDAQERREYEAHLATCERCREELASFSEAATALAYGIEAPPPSPQLRERILVRAREERPNVVPMRPRWALPAAATAAIAVAAAIALAIWATSLNGRLDRSQQARADQERAAAIISSSDARSFAAGRARVYVVPGGEGALVVDRLDAARPGMTYEAWIAQGGKPRPAGTFDAQGDVTAVPLEGSVPQGATVMVTEERDGGTSAPTHMPFVIVKTT